MKGGPIMRKSILVGTAVRALLAGLLVSTVSLGAGCSGVDAGGVTGPARERPPASIAEFSTHLSDIGAPAAGSVQEVAVGDWGYDIDAEAAYAFVTTIRTKSGHEYDAAIVAVYGAGSNEYGNPLYYSDSGGMAWYPSGDGAFLVMASSHPAEDTGDFQGGQWLAGDALDTFVASGTAGGRVVYAAAGKSVQGSRSPGLPAARAIVVTANRGYGPGVSAVEAPFLATILGLPDPFADPADTDAHTDAMEGDLAAAGLVGHYMVGYSTEGDELEWVMEDEYPSRREAIEAWSGTR